jgi:hypothetical protein
MICFQILKLDGHVMADLRKDNILQMTSTPVEGIQLHTLVTASTDNAMLGKVILALAAITEEMLFLTSEEELKAKFLDPLSLYGSEITGSRRHGSFPENPFDIHVTFFSRFRPGGEHGHNVSPASSLKRLVLLR